MGLCKVTLNNIESALSLAQTEPKTTQPQTPASKPNQKIRDVTVLMLGTIYCDLQTYCWEYLLSLKLLAITMTVGVVFVLIGVSALSAQFRNNDGLIHGKGTVRYLSFEGGFYGIVGDDGKNYDPTNMPQEFKADGLRVQFTANLTDHASYHMWGYVVKLISIEKLP